MKDLDTDAVNESSEDLKMPINVMLEAAKRDLMFGILSTQERYALPNYLIDILVTACLADIREIVKKDLIDSLSQTKEE